MHTPRVPSAIRRLSLLAAGLLCTDPAWAAWPHDPFTNLRVASAAIYQWTPAAVPDGAGGALIAYVTGLGGFYDIRAQHVTADGTIAPGWPSSGVAICSATGDQTHPAAVSDGAGGMLIAWEDGRAGSQRDIYVQRVTGAGAIPAGWPVDGRGLSAVTKDEKTAVICSDGARGAFVGWTLTYSATDYDVQGAHVDSAGTVVWSASVANQLGTEDSPAIAADGAGGAVFVYRDSLAGNSDIKAVRRNAVGGVVYGPVSICNQAADQVNPKVICDATGVATVGWIDKRAGNWDVYANRMSPAGAAMTGWSAQGNEVCATTGNQTDVLITTDGGQGAYFSWADDRSGGLATDVYIQRMAAGGSRYPGWPWFGVVACGELSGQHPQDLTPDGVGGVIVSWLDGRTDGADIYALRMTGAGAIAPGWSADGVAVCTADYIQGGVRACVDASGNAILAWQDSRAAITNIYAQRLESFGQLGNPEPAITKVRDVLADQGGKVRIDWNASWMDTYPAFGIGQYWIWREAPAAAVERALARGAKLLDAAALDALASSDGEALSTVASHGLYTTTTVNALTYNWEFLYAAQASGFPTYSYVAETTTDSTAAHNYRTAFMVQARAPSGIAFWNSAPSLGSSVDNLPPIAPAPFLAAFAAGVTHLHWGANSEEDLFGYRLYRGSSSGFVPGPGNLVSAQPDTGYGDPGAAGSWYKLSAVDVHGNESALAVLGPSGTTAVDPTLPRALAFATPSPNPARAVTRLEFALPQAARVTLAIYDAGGRRMRAMIDGILPGGVHAMPWSLADDGGRPVANGIYFARLETQGRTFVRRIAVMR
jgi:hypothetical protein